MTPHAIRRMGAFLLPATLAACALAAPLTAVRTQAAPGYSGNTTGGSRVTGTATYRERIALPKTAVFDAVLEDVTRAGAAAIVIGRTRIASPGQVPIRFEIAYDPRDIKADRVYAVRATIHDGGRMLWTSDARHAVLTHSNPNTVEILLRRAGSAPGGDGGGGRGPGGDRGGNRGGRGDATLAPLPATFTGQLPCADCMGIQYQLNLLKDGAYMQRTTYLRSGHDASYYEIGRWELSSDLRTLVLEGGREGNAYWSLENSNTLRKLDRAGRPIESRLRYDLTRAKNVVSIGVRARMSGTFRSMADAPRFRECRSGLEWPVLMGEDYLALERAYSREPKEPGAGLMVMIEGRLVQRRKTDGEGTEPALVVEKFVRAMPNETCAPRAAQVELANTRWVPTQVNGKAVVVGKGQREAWIVFEPKGLRLTGSGGCNRLSGGYRAASGGRLTLEKIASTMMACPNMNAERAFLDALEATRTFRIAGRHLELFDAGGTMVARLEERNL